MSSKIPKTQNLKALAAATTLVLFWVIGLNLPGRADDAHLFPAPLTPGLPSSLLPEQNYASVSSADLVLGPADSEALCSRFHLDVYDPTKPKEGGQPQQRPPRKVYDLLLITPETSIDVLELHLAQTSPFVDYFILLESPSIADFIPKPEAPPEPEWWERDEGHIETAPPGASLPSTATTADEVSFLEKVWESRLYPYHDKIIRRTLSRFSSDFAPGKDHEAAARNAVYTQVVPFLTGMQKAEIGDVLILSDLEELLRPVTLQVLRYCDIPHITTVRTRRYWYSFQWVKMDTAEIAPEVTVEGAPDAAHIKAPVNPAPKEPSNERWSHPQVTIYEGTETLLPMDLRNDRSKDEYVFVDGGWTCKLCYASISETLQKAGEMGLIWHNGPRWKAAGRLVDRTTRGIDLFDRTKLSRVEANPDIPFYLRENPHRFRWMLDRDPHGANFNDFDEAGFLQYMAKKKEVDAEKDTEVDAYPLIWNLATTQSWNDPEFAPAEDNAPAPVEVPATDGDPLVQIAAPDMSDQEKEFLEKAKEDPNSGLTAADIAVLDQIAGGGDIVVYGED